MAFCGDDRIELDCGGALSDLLLILEYLLLSRLGCLHEGHALKAPNPFFLQLFPPSFFSGVGSCVGLLPWLLSYILCSMEFLAPFIGVEVLSYLYRVATKFCLGHFSKFHLFHIIKNSEITAANEQQSIPGLSRKFRTWNHMLFYLFLPERFWSNIHSTWVLSWCRSSNKPSVHISHQPSDWKRYWYLTSSFCSKNHFRNWNLFVVLQFAYAIEWNFWLGVLNSHIILVKQKEFTTTFLSSW